MKNLNCFIIDKIDYFFSLELQLALNLLRQEEKILDTIILLEHPNTISMGLRGSKDDVLLSEKEIKEKQVKVEWTNRGGQNTLHAPGQLVCYFIISLKNNTKNIKNFVKNITNAIQTTISEYIDGSYIMDDLSGVWINNNGKCKKVASIGIAIKNKVTMHGISINLNVPVEKFSWLLSCGLSGENMISLKHVLKKEIDFAQFREQFIKNLLNNISYKINIKKKLDIFANKLYTMEKIIEEFNI